MSHQFLRKTKPTIIIMATEACSPEATDVSGSALVLLSGRPLMSPNLFPWWIISSTESQVSWPVGMIWSGGSRWPY